MTGSSSRHVEVVVDSIGRIELAIEQCLQCLLILHCDCEVQAFDMSSSKCTVDKLNKYQTPQPLSKPGLFSCSYLFDFVHIL